MSEKISTELQISIAKRDNLIKKVKDLLALSKTLKSDSSKLPLFRTRLEQLESVYDTLGELCDKINTLNISVDPNNKIDYTCWNSFEETYFEIKAFASSKLIALYPSTSASKDNSCITDRVEASKMSRPRLPEIELPTWDSTFKNWSSFHDKFKSLIHDSETISDIDKFQYLLSAVKGPALSNIRGSLPIIGDNYKIVWESLVRKYQNKRILGTDILERIVKFPVLSKETASSLNDFLEQFCYSVNALAAVNIPNLSDFILLYLGLQRLPFATRKLFEQNHLCSEVPTFDQLATFLENHIKVLEVSGQNKTIDIKQDKGYYNSREGKVNFVNPVSKLISRKAFISSTSNKNDSCSICKSNHSVYKCPTFHNLSPSQRRTRIRNLKHCFNCLKDSHMASECPSKLVCHCGERHHTLLHSDKNASFGSSSRNFSPQMVEPIPETSVKPTSCHASINNNYSSTVHTTVLLGTAVIHIKDSKGTFQPIRILIDSGAQTSIITTSCVQKLGLPIRHCSISVSGLGKNPLLAKGITTCNLKPRDSSFPELTTEAVILPKITSDMPSIKVSEAVCHKFRHLILADPNFNSPSSIDLLVAADLFPQIYDGQRLTHTDGPSALHSIFGWVVTGKLEQNPCISDATSLVTSIEPSLDHLLKSFWEYEEPPKVNIPNPDDVKCEQMYTSLHYRDDSGRYVVPLLFKDNCPELPSVEKSYRLALNRLLSSERRLSQQPELQRSYSDFLEEYENLNHMERVPTLSAKYFIPHHPVMKPNSLSTQVRVVFDATAKLPGNVSLNNCLLPGPKLHQDVCSVITRFRLHKFALVADMRKMFRQILIRPEDRSYLHILWRSSPSDEIREFELKTVTYGTVSAPYLALRSVIQLVQDEGAPYPFASRALLSDTYVDNIVSGTSTKKDLILLKDELIALLQRGGLQLHQWNSNDRSIFHNLPESDRHSYSLSFEQECPATISILGLQWDALTDFFFYNVTPINLVLTKRSILSHIARIYDPLGWLSPSVFKAKLIIQHLWRLGLGWDDKVPLYLAEEWTAFARQLPNLSHIRIARHFLTTPTSKPSLVGFCDASERGYGAVVYLCVSDEHHVSTCHILMAKTKVAPLKPMSIPRLELCAALLLSKLIKTSLEFLQDRTVLNKIITFSDSTTVLAWLKTPPHLLKTFVGTRVSEILEIISPTSWHHISSTENPADCASRGILPDVLVDHSLWWKGPTWLTESFHQWPLFQHTLDISKHLPELRTETSLNTFVLSEESIPLLFQYSSLTKLKRVAAWCFRFIKNSQVPIEIRISGPLRCRELNDALLLIVKQVQNINFQREFRLLNEGKPCSPAIQSLRPFIDSRGLLRVGGRLINSSVSINMMHPLLLPKSSVLTTLIIDYYHVAYLHVGPRTLQSLICRQFWIISARNVIRSRLSKCNICHKVRASDVKAPLMGNLPLERVTQGRPFVNVATDFGGPFIIKESRRRGAKTYKSYLCLFVCLATKAVHLELVTDLTSEAFIASLNRFVSRHHIF